MYYPSISLCLTDTIMYSFDLQLEKFGVDMKQLKEPATTCLFRAWVEDWEEELLKDNDCVAEARLLEKYKNLVFHDPDTDATFTVASQNMEYRRGRNGGWYLVCEPNNDKEEAEPFTIPLADELIGQTLQADGIKVIQKAATEGSAD